MSDGYLQLRSITFNGPKINSGVRFSSGVNVICGASDTGKSFFAESVDFMLGGSDLREIPERAKYSEIELNLNVSNGDEWRLRRSTSGGSTALLDTEDPDAKETVLKQNHAHDRTDNLSGFLLEKIGLLGKRILKSSAKGTTQSLSFRNLARLVIVQEGEIQQRGSPFWSGQYTTKTSEMATIKLLLTGIDDSAVVSIIDNSTDNTKQIEIIDELLSDISTDIEDNGEDQEELKAQLDKLEKSINSGRDSLSAAQRELDSLLSKRRVALEEKRAISGRLDEISDLLARFDLLRAHYIVDLERLVAIRESGSMFAHVEAVFCPLCGAPPEAQHLEVTCEGDVDVIVLAATAEIEKIARLQSELNDTVEDLMSEEGELKGSLIEKEDEYEDIDKTIQETVGPEVSAVRTSFSELVEKRSDVQRAISLFIRREKLEERRLSLVDDGEENAETGKVTIGVPDSVAHAFSQKVSAILKAWNFPGECLVHFDKQVSDFVIDGKPRGSRGKGLRAITHAAVSIGLLEYCQEKGMSHPGFVVLDSPLLAYFKPEGDDDLELKGTDLKEKFYEYLVEHHGEESQVIIVENQHPPLSVQGRLKMKIFTGNPNDGRFGLL
jgi:predicted nuclease with TOPRIM domain